MISQEEIEVADPLLRNESAEQAVMTDPQDTSPSRMTTSGK